jgi:hypothetical protein
MNSSAWAGRRSRSPAAGRGVRREEAHQAQRESHSRRAGGNVVRLPPTDDESAPGSERRIVLLRLAPQSDRAPSIARHEGASFRSGRAMLGAPTKGDLPRQAGCKPALRLLGRKSAGRAPEPRRECVLHQAVHAGEFESPAAPFNTPAHPQLFRFRTLPIPAPVRTLQIPGKTVTTTIPTFRNGLCNAAKPVPKSRNGHCKATTGLPKIQNVRRNAAKAIPKTRNSLRNTAPPIRKTRSASCKVSGTVAESREANESLAKCGPQKDGPRQRGCSVRRRGRP